MNATSRALFVLLFLPSAASAQKLTYEEAKARIPSQELPEFWIGGVDEILDVQLTLYEVLIRAAMEGR